MKKHKVSIIGCGALGTLIGEVVCKDLTDKYEVLGVYSRTGENTKRLANHLSCKAYETFDEVIDDKPDYLIEAANPDVIKEIGVRVLENGINLIPLSVGAFADEDFYKVMEKKAIENNVRVHMPAGAVGGFDVLHGSMLTEDVDISIVTEKSPRSLNGAPFLRGRKLSEEKEEEIFTGSASEAIKCFPKNINVAVATALATKGVNDTKVVIKSVPGLMSNKHHIKSKGDTIEVNISIESTPSANNPKSSTLAAYSVIALLKNLVSPITY